MHTQKNMTKPVGAACKAIADCGPVSSVGRNWFIDNRSINCKGIDLKLDLVVA